MHSPAGAPQLLAVPLVAMQQPCVLAALLNTRPCKLSAEQTLCCRWSHGVCRRGHDPGNRAEPHHAGAWAHKPSLLVPAWLNSFAGMLSQRLCRRWSTDSTRNLQGCHWSALRLRRIVTTSCQVTRLLSLVLWTMCCRLQSGLRAPLLQMQSCAQFATHLHFIELSPANLHASAPPCQVNVVSRHMRGSLPSLCRGAPYISSIQARVHTRDLPHK